MGLSRISTWGFPALTRCKNFCLLRRGVLDQHPARNSCQSNPSLPETAASLTLILRLLSLTVSTETILASLKRLVSNLKHLEAHRLRHYLRLKWRNLSPQAHEYRYPTSSESLKQLFSLAFTTSGEASFPGLSILFECKSRHFQRHLEYASEGWYSFLFPSGRTLRHQLVRPENSYKGGSRTVLTGNLMPPRVTDTAYC